MTVLVCHGVAYGDDADQTPVAHGSVVSGAPDNALLGAPWAFDAEHAKLVGVHVLGETHFAGLPLDINASSVQSYARKAPRVVIVVGHLASARAPSDLGITPGDAARASFDWLRSGVAASRAAGDAITVNEDREGSDEPGVWNLALSWTNATTDVTSTLRGMAVLTSSGMALTYGECFYGAPEGGEAAAGAAALAQVAQDACSEALAVVASPIARDKRVAFEISPRRLERAAEADLVGGLNAGEPGGVQMVVSPRKTARKPFYLVGGLIILAGVLWYIVGAVRRKKS